MTDTVFAPIKRDVRLHGKIPLVGHYAISYPILVRDAILARVKVMPFFANGGFTFVSSRNVQIQPQSLPFCAVYFLNEIGGPVPEPQTDVVAFRPTVRIGVSVIILNNDAEQAELTLDRAAQTLAFGLFADPTLRDNAAFKIQAFISTSRQHQFGNIGQNSETPIVELRWEIVIDLGTVTYEPQPIDVFETMHVEVDYGVDGAPTITEQYDLEQNEG